MTTHISKITFCNTVTGRVIGNAILSPGTLAGSPANCIQVEGAYLPSDYYYDTSDSQIKPRTDVTLTWDKTTVAASETATLSGLPIPCNVYVETIDDDVYVDDGTLEVTFTDPGFYKVEFNEVVYKRQDFEIEVT